MVNKQIFNEVKTKYFQMLKQYVPIVARVHGKNHPEFHDVQKLFDSIAKKIQVAGPEVPDLNEEFTELRKFTSNYTIPGDVCESYEAVYNMLAELDQAYQA